jgi:hypothetical protein
MAGIKSCRWVKKEDKDPNREQKADQARWKHDKVEETTKISPNNVVSTSMPVNKYEQCRFLREIRLSE